MAKPTFTAGDFEAEAKAHIEKIESAFLEAESLKNSPEMINDVFRAAHSLKGTAGFFSYKKIVDVTHELESIFTLIKNGKLEIDDDIIDLSLMCVDCLNEILNNGDADITDVLNALGRYTGGETSFGKEADKVGGIPFDISTDRVKHGENVFYINMNFNRSLGKYYKNPDFFTGNVYSVAEVIAVIIGDEKTVKEPERGDLTAKISLAVTKYDTFDLKMLVDSVLTRELLSAATEIDKDRIQIIDNSRKTGESEYKKNTLSRQSRGEVFTLRVDVSKINSLMNLSNEMILARNRLLSEAANYKELAPALRDVDLLTSEIQEKVMQARMQPASSVLNKFPRIIRDTAKSLGKEISAEIISGDVMLDKYMLDALIDPITQLVKNAADHGVESVEKRISLGKPPNGRITLGAYMRDGHAVVEITDDGAGIDAEALKKKAAETNTASESEIAAMSESEVFSLMFKPGISTAKEITNISGRGVGMDIVKTNIEKLGGNIEISSEYGMSTSIRLITPLTLTVIRTLIIIIGGIRYAVPETNVEKIVRVRGTRPEIRLNGRIIPTFAMGEIAARINPDCEYAGEERNSAVKYTVIKARDRSFALLTDAAAETAETLISPLPVFFGNCPCYSGATVLGDGNAVMILDADGIAALMNVALNRTYETDNGDGADDGQIHYVSFKCPGGKIHNIEIRKVSRIESIDAHFIKEKKGGVYAEIYGKSIRVISPDDFKPLKKFAGGLAKYCLVSLETGGGFIAEKVLDIALRRGEAV